MLESQRFKLDVEARATEEIGNMHMSDSKLRSLKDEADADMKEEQQKDQARARSAIDSAVRDLFFACLNARKWGAKTPEMAATSSLAEVQEFKDAMTYLVKQYEIQTSGVFTRTNFNWSRDASEETKGDPQI